MNCLRTSTTTAPAARDTALIASPENKKTTAAPMIKPTRLRGLATSRTPWYWDARSPAFCPASSTAFLIASVNAPKSAVAARTAVAIAMPLVIAFVVLPTASRDVRIFEPSPSTSPDISAIPCALSEIGPNVSIATITPTVVNKPVPANAIARSESTMFPPPSKKAPNTADAIITAE
ncbi:unannotated protein [freshwater metagenome]|uniref:Unannotated protein n=1 Tax=freshwater metagenome TaxID=449393 RepID=A0A6J6WDL5_9ZZZZ